MKKLLLIGLVLMGSSMLTSFDAEANVVKERKAPTSLTASSNLSISAAQDFDFQPVMLQDVFNPLFEKVSVAPKTFIDVVGITPSTEVMNKGSPG